MIAPDCQHRHLQSAVTDGCLVIEHILIERRELGKTRMHPTRFCVKVRIMSAGSLVEPGRVGGKVIPEPIEIDALTALNQPLHVGSTESEVPQQRALENIVPW